MLVLADLQQEIELLREERVVVLEIEAEQWERFDERTAADDHLRAALRYKVECRELLEQPHRIDRAEDRHSARQANSFRTCSRGCEDHRRSRVEELLPMVLAEPEHVQPELIGMFNLFEQIAH